MVYQSVCFLFYEVSIHFCNFGVIMMDWVMSYIYYCLVVCRKEKKKKIMLPFIEKLQQIKLNLQLYTQISRNKINLKYKTYP